MEKINIPQVWVSYAGGSCGEWLAYQISQHEKYLKYDIHEEMELEVNALNRCRITGNWIAELMNEGIPQSNIWNEVQYTGSEVWWKNFWEQAPEKEPFYEQVKDMINRKACFGLPVHRSHEAWYGVFWADLFEEFRIVSIYVDKTDKKVFEQLQSNIIKKIWWQDLTDDQDLKEELWDKFRKLTGHESDCYSGRPEDVLDIIKNKFSGEINYTDMMFAINYHYYGTVAEATKEVLFELSNRWNRYHIHQHKHVIPGDHIRLDFGKMFVYNDYSEYQRLCEFLETPAWPKEQWDKIVGEYTQDDIDTFITIGDVEERIKKRARELKND